MAPEMDWLQPQKNGLSMVLHVVPERGWYGALKWTSCSPKKMDFQWCCMWCLNGAGMAPEHGLVAAPKNGLSMVLQVVPERGWYGA